MPGAAPCGGREDIRSGPRTDPFGRGFAEFDSARRARSEAGAGNQGDRNHLRHRCQLEKLLSRTASRLAQRTIGLRSNGKIGICSSSCMDGHRGPPNSRCDVIPNWTENGVRSTGSRSRSRHFAPINGRTPTLGPGSSRFHGRNLSFRTCLRRPLKDCGCGNGATVPKELRQGARVDPDRSVEVERFE